MFHFSFHDWKKRYIDLARKVARMQGIIDQQHRELEQFRNRYFDEEKKKVGTNVIILPHKPKESASVGSIKSTYPKEKYAATPSDKIGDDIGFQFVTDVVEQPVPGGTTCGC